MDWPYRYWGQRHRVLFHNSLDAMIIAQVQYPGDPNAVLAALVHIELDEMCSNDPYFKRMLKLYADAEKRQKRKTRTGIKGKKKGKTRLGGTRKRRRKVKTSSIKMQVQLSPELERSLKNLEKMAEIRRIICGY
jgi:hypothetical protein